MLLVVSALLVINLSSLLLLICASFNCVPSLWII